ncbi:hypothetical protein H8B02_28575 [Bradyrhizobium sp. Pear77]|uniref:hypothetical protein n=1 Tax=Bradyrhizobium altum TaxID=1571202 RepID=UPI001E3BECE9|nr:hypothetical protein [Bradyrhizobium altum]MCC8957247.1 hypothetical protein [Bradyrhizobium altum]
MKKTIKQEFEKRDGIAVVDVVMIKESAAKATDFVKLSVPLFGGVTKACSATMGEGSQYIWRCE